MTSRAARIAKAIARTNPVAAAAYLDGAALREQIDRMAAEHLRSRSPHAAHLERIAAAAD